MAERYRTFVSWHHSDPIMQHCLVDGPTVEAEDGLAAAHAVLKKVSNPLKYVAVLVMLEKALPTFALAELYRVIDGRPVPFALEQSQRIVTWPPK